MTISPQQIRKTKIEEVSKLVDEVLEVLSFKEKKAEVNLVELKIPKYLWDDLVEKYKKEWDVVVYKGIMTLSHKG